MEEKIKKKNIDNKVHLEKCFEEFFCDNKNEKVIFIGSGFSKNLGMPTWEEFAYMHLDILKENNEINFETYELLRKENFRTVISVAKHYIDKNEVLSKKTKEKYIETFKVEFNIKNEFNGLDTNKILNISDKEFELIEKLRKKDVKLKKIKDEINIYKKIYNLNLINVTTNYDDILDILAREEVEFYNKSSDISKEKKVFYTESDFNKIESNNIKSGQVFHIHGSINDIDNMILSNEDYIRRYWNGENIYKKFLKKIFDEYNVIFFGYSLQELEILNYLFEGGKGILNQTDKKRILILDSFGYEYEKVEFLRRYYEENYCIDLCTYNKSEIGFEEVSNIVDLMKDIKDKSDRRNKDYLECLEILKMIDLSPENLEELLNKLVHYKDLQSDFFKKIDGEYKYYIKISENKYFKSENTNLLSILRYINSVYDNIGNIKIEDITDLYNLSLNYNMDNSTMYEFIIFICKFNKLIMRFKLDELINKSKIAIFKDTFIDTIVREFDKDYIVNFFKENEKVMKKLIAKQIFYDKFFDEIVLYQNEFMKYICENEDKDFIDSFIDEYKTVYMKDKAGSEKFEVTIKDKQIYVKYKNNTTFNLIFDGLKNIYRDIDDEVKIIKEDKDEIKKLISSLFSHDSYSSIFDDYYLVNDTKFKILLNISKSRINGDYLIERLFKSEIYLLKKISLYFVINNKKSKYLINKIMAEDFDLEYMIRNDEFSGEIKEVFKLTNNYENIFEIKESFLLNTIEKGEFFIYFDESEEEKEIWKYVRFKELKNLGGIFEKLQALKDKIKNADNYNLTPMIGEVEVRDIKRLASIEKEQALKMSLDEWITHMNNYKKKENENFYERYEIAEDIKLFIECIKRNVNSFMPNIRILNKVKDYEWLNYIFYEIDEMIKDKRNNLSMYYLEILNFINQYIDKIDSICENSNKNSVSKKSLIKNIYSLSIDILYNIVNLDEKIKNLYKDIIGKLENTIYSNKLKKDKVLEKDISFTKFYSSIERYILELEILFIFKIKGFEDEREYRTRLLENRKAELSEEFCIFFGERIDIFMKIDSEFSKNFIKNDINTKFKKQLFLMGFSYFRVIDKEIYELVKSIVLEVFNDEITSDIIKSSIIEYFILAFLLDYENADLDILDNKNNIDRGSIFKMFALKKSCIKLNENYNEIEYKEKLIEVWEKLLNVDWEEKEFELIDATLKILDDLDYINETIEKNLKNILTKSNPSFMKSRNICKYLKRVFNKSNKSSVITIIKCYRSDKYDKYMVELIEYIKKDLNAEELESFKNFWISLNKYESPFRSYLNTI